MGKKKNSRKKEMFIHVSFFSNTQGIATQSVIKEKNYYEILHCRVFFFPRSKTKSLYGSKLNLLPNQCADTYHMFVIHTPDMRQDCPPSTVWPTEE